ncbi:MAG TPA: SIS domain-containing protein [Mycobacteriales bacterium]|jgi:D-sedoheptulose 7-phosphate isomerase|nr:SIS domain-containing protein [Mycobacteriales bacterium]
MAGVTEGEALLRQRVTDSLQAKQRLLESDAVRATAEAAELVVRALSGGGKVLFFGNGGSATDAGHLAAELLGRFYLERRPLAAVSLADNTAAMTAIGNDYSYEETFSRQVRALGRPGDVAVGLSTSGNSPNVVRGLEAAGAAGLATVVFTGAGGGKLSGLVDVCVRVPTDDTPRVQELCMLLGHTLCEIVERDLAGS